MTSSEFNDMIGHTWSLLWVAEIRCALKIVHTQVMKLFLFRNKMHQMGQEWVSRVSTLQSTNKGITAQHHNPGKPDDHRGFGSDKKIIQHEDLNFEHNILYKGTACGKCVWNMIPNLMLCYTYAQALSALQNTDQWLHPDCLWGLRRNPIGQR